MKQAANPGSPEKQHLNGGGGGMCVHEQLLEWQRQWR